MTIDDEAHRLSVRRGGRPLAPAMDGGSVADDGPRYDLRRFRRRRLVVLLTLLLATAAAAPAPAAAQEPPNPPDPAIVDGSAQKALDRARARWKAARIGSYRYEARRACFCIATGWHVVDVRKGVPSKKVHADVRDIATIPRVFRQIQRAIVRRAHDLTVTYSTHGVPTRVSIDSYQNVIDEEQDFTIRRFKRR